MSSWKSILSEIRNSGSSRRYDMRTYWRAQSYRERETSPEPVIRARAFATVLENIELYAYLGEHFAGSTTGFYRNTLPEGISDKAYQSAVALCRERGQRNFGAGFDHTLADYPTLLERGINGLLEKIQVSRRSHKDAQEKACLDAMQITITAFGTFIQRHGEPASGAACEQLATRPPQTLHEAMQLVWLTHVAFSSEGRHHMALGRMDQYLYPFYRRDIGKGALTRNQVLDLFCEFFARLEEIAEVQNICIGGLTPDGEDATNELSHICLEAVRQVRTPYANLSARFHDHTPDTFFRAGFETIRTGVGFPAIFNDEVLIPGLEALGIPVDVARDHCMVGCIETMLAGRQPAWSDSRFNTPCVLMDALHHLRGLKRQTYRALIRVFRRKLDEAMADHAARINRYIERFPVERFPDPFLSALTRDCIGRARDINDGGAEYPRFHGVAVMGLATTADSLAAVKKLVSEDKQLTLDFLLTVLEADFDGYESVRQMLMNKAPKYGNDADEVDGIAADIVTWTSETCLRQRLSCGGRFVPLVAANVANIAGGKEVGATPDGRLAGTPLSDAASPYFGRDRKGPTAFLNSVSVPDYRRVPGGTVINMRFDPEHFRDENGADRFTALMKVFVKQRIPQMQFNFTDDETLRLARKNPEAYRDLVVRVSGFSAYFVTLPSEVQDDIMRRRAHG